MAKKDKKSLYKSMNASEYDDYCSYIDDIIEQERNNGRQTRRNRYNPRRESEYGTIPITSYLDDISIEDDVQERARKHYRRRGL